MSWLPELETSIRNYNLEKLKVLNNKLKKRIEDYKEKFQDLYEINKEEVDNFYNSICKIEEHANNELTCYIKIDCSSKEEIKKNFEIAYAYVKKNNESLNNRFQARLLIEQYFIDAKLEYLKEAEKISKINNNLNYNNSLEDIINLQLIYLLIANNNEIGIRENIKYLLKGVGYSNTAVSCFINKIVKERKLNFSLFEKLEIEINVLEKYFKLYESLNYNLNNSEEFLQNLEENREELYKAVLIINLCCSGINYSLKKLNSEGFSLNVDYVSLQEIIEEFENKIDNIQNNLKKLSSAVFSEIKKHEQELRVLIEDKISFLKERKDSKSQTKLNFYKRIQKAFGYVLHQRE
ncbi:MAG: hypothetical protein QXU20_02100 [Candidatus Woesearchaeota archaeon]